MPAKFITKAAKGLNIKPDARYKTGMGIITIRDLTAKAAIMNITAKVWFLGACSATSSGASSASNASTGCTIKVSINSIKRIEKVLSKPFI